MWDMVMDEPRYRPIHEDVAERDQQGTRQQ